MNLHIVNIMMPLYKFNEDHMLKTCGLTNIGSICYLNSFIQSLMSCTSITNFFLTHEKKFILEENNVAIEYIKLLKLVKNVKSYNDIINPSGVFREIILATKKKFPNKQFGRGQEDSGEVLTLFLDAIDSEELYTYFMYKYAVKIWCLTCVKQISDTMDESCILEIPSYFDGMDDNSDDIKKMDPLNSYILQYISILDDYTCPHCKLQKCCRIYQLARSPEIITIMFNKYFTKTNIKFPTMLSFPSLNDSVIEYKIVSKIEHSGNQNHGHYWTHCFRTGEPKNIYEDNSKGMYCLNDKTISQGTSEPTQNSYLVFYHNI
jgi:ubiquitin C-terminal hydrolase